MKSIQLSALLLLLFSSRNLAISQPIKSPKASSAHQFYLGADLSYVNEMEDCGGWWSIKGAKKDPYALFADAGCSIVRVRIWNHADWTKYSNLEDVKKTIRRSKDQKMRTLLDFHYSDNWADPGHQTIPKAWKEIMEPKILADSVFAFTYNTLMALAADGLLPDLVQVGNEINSEVMQYSEKSEGKINWERNVTLLNSGLSAVNQVSKKTKKPIGTMLHIAQPDEAFAWFSAAKQHGIKPYDWIGLSYYTQWSKFDLAQLKAEIQKLKTTFKKRVMVVEAGYPFTLENADQANNLYDTTSQLHGYTISPAEQRRFMIDMTKAVISGGGEGVIYWEPAWISTNCKTQWAVGSHCDNATFFDPANKNEALPVFDFFNEALYKKPKPK